MTPFFRGWFGRIVRRIVGLLPPPFIRYVPPPVEWKSLLAQFPHLAEQIEAFHEMPPPTWETKRLRYTSFLWEADPELMIPGPNVKITVRFLLVDLKGNVYTFEVSLPPGMPYDRDYVLTTLRATIMDAWEDEKGRFLTADERKKTYDLAERIIAEDYFITRVELLF